MSQDSDYPLRIHPPLRACLRFGLVLIPAVMGAAIVFGEIKRAINDIPHSEPLLWLQLAASAVALGVLLGVFVYASMRPWACTIAAEGVAGRSFWGRRHRIAWGEVTSVGSTSFEGIPALVIGAAPKGREVIAYTLGVDLQAFHSRLARYAGADHILTRAFVGAGT